MKKPLLALAFVFGALFGHSAFGQEYPSGPIRLIVPFGPGAGVDILARGVGKLLTERMGQPVVVENRPGAGGNIGVDTVAKAAPDGYTLLMGSNGPLAANVSLYEKLTFDPAKDLTPIVLMGRLPMILVANNAAPAGSVSDLVRLAKSSPGAVNFGASNTTARVWIDLIGRMTDTKSETVQYKNVGTLLADLMGGQIQYAVENVGPSMPQIRAGKIKALAVTSHKRAGFAPEIPSFGEVGLTRYDLVVWYAMFAPNGTPADIVQRLNAEVNKMMRDEPEIARLAASVGMEVEGGTPQQLGEFQKAEIAKWDELVRTTGIKLY
ncbi:MAG: tripartite tricarboxylate transporter substrate binding protein [Burkholderiaceae bacterium]|nr:tripartite tricarboxylate transporter substrate binding protein [Burkholderiaceae bacterium]